jgi:hypothetical protein
MTRDIRNYQLLVICNARSNVTSLNLSLKKGQNTTKKSQSCVKIVKLPIQKLLVFFFARQGLSDLYQIRSSLLDLIILVLRKKTTNNEYVFMHSSYQFCLILRCFFWILELFQHCDIFLLYRIIVV